MKQTLDGGYICGSSTASSISCDKSEASLGGDDYWIVKLDSFGTIEWQNTIGGSLYDEIYSISLTNDGGFMCAGTSPSGASGDKTENTCSGSNDWWILKLDSIGNIQWQKTIGGQGIDYLRFALQSPNNGYYCAGYSSSDSSCQKSEFSKGVDDFWFAKLDTVGNLIWEKTIGGNHFDRFCPLAITRDGECIGGGWSASSISGNKTDTCRGTWDYWIVKLTGRFNLITGDLFVDLNSNNLQDIGEPILKNKMVKENSTGRFSISNQNSFYSLSVLDSGNYNVSPSPLNYYNCSPSAHSINFPSINQTDSVNDFAFQPQGVFNDIAITITPYGDFTPGFGAGYFINYENVGTTTLSPIITLHQDPLLNFMNATVNPTSVSQDSIQWNLSAITPFQSGNILVTFLVDTTAILDSVIYTHCTIEPIINDANFNNNSNNSSVTITGSYDPNDILVSEDTLFTTQLPSQPWLDYIIRFQNTGNDTAFTVKILNPIDTTKLELSSIEFVNSSHPVNLSWIPWEHNMEFTFNNILLPDSNINEPLSHGFVHYRIKPKTTLLAGASITNNAYIYFDFNAPVATNTAITRIVLPTGISNIQSPINNIQLYPNPAKDEITITGYTLQNNQPALLKIYDVMGNDVYHSSVTTLNTKLKTLNFASGVYFVQLQTGLKVSRTKFIKQ